MRRLREKVTGYVQAHTDTRDAHLHHVLFVLPTDSREEGMVRVVRDEYPPTRDGCCRFWTTTRERLNGLGPLGAIWVRAIADEKPKNWWEPDPPARLRQRRSLIEFSAHERMVRDVDGSIGKPGWWLRRPGGGEGP